LGGIGIFLTLQANTLICTQFLDLKTTASYGFSLQVVQALAGFSVVWIQAKMPEITALRARNAIHQIVGVFAPRMHLTLLTYLVGALFLIGAGPFFVQAIHAGTPLLPVPLLLALLVISGLEMHHSLYMQLVLTENRNPFLALSLVTGAGIVLGSLWLTPLYGVAGILLAQGLVQACGNNWWPVHRAARGLGGRMYWMAFFRQAERT
jgi:O-antigen/teichoic acid export membrane protein